MSTFVGSLTVLRVWFHIWNHLKRGRVPMYLATRLLEIAYEYRISILSEALHESTHRMNGTTELICKLAGIYPSKRQSTAAFLDAATNRDITDWKVK